MPERAALLFANEAFYRAFADRDMAAMAALWSETAMVACIHPGWGPLQGRDAVLDSWAGILANPASPDISCHDATAHVLGDSGFVICYEHIAGQFLIATNVFVRDGRLWKMVHHQGGPTSTRPAAAAAPETPGTVN